MNRLRELLLKSEDPQNRREVADQFNANPNESVLLLDEVFQKNSTKFADYKKLVLNLVDLLSDKLAIEVITRALDDSNSKIQVKGLQATYRRQIDSLNEQISRLLTNSDEEFEVRKWAVHILGGTDPINYGRFLRKTMKNRDDDVNLRKEAIFALTHNTSDETVGALCTLLGDSNVEIRRSAAWALAKVSSEDSISCFLAALEDTDEEVRDWSIRGLRDMDSSRALQGLADAMTRSVPKEQEQLIRLVVEKKSEIILRALVELLESPVVSVRRLAAWAMGVSPYSPAVGSLERILDDEDPQTREYAKKALERLGHVDPSEFGRNL